MELWVLSRAIKKAEKAIETDLLFNHSKKMAEWLTEILQEDAKDRTHYADSVILALFLVICALTREAEAKKSKI